MEMSEREKRSRHVFEAIGKFMFDHGLDPNPANYMLLHKLVTRSNPVAVAAIEEAVNDGIRLTQREIDRIIAVVGDMPDDSHHALQTFDEAASEEAQRQIAQFSALVESTRAAAHTYEQELEDNASRLVDGAQSLAELIRVTSTMIERTRAAERQLEAATVEAQGLREKLLNAQEEARRDPLTGLPNRRAFEDHYAALLKAKTPLSVVLCDLDQFKAINDTHGHTVGDRVLRAVAETLNASFDGAMVARYGGEEFAVVLPRVSADDACDMVDRARKMVARRRFKVRETDAPLGTITFSAGVAYCADGGGKQALERADILLYRAKAGGRDRIEMERVAA
jgi:diguanylate cyclase